ncbi:hypothetical protein COE80_19410 [Bacillus pseudomycoides]|uniref:DNA polymerase n=1 Tax=Bacillus pseudomycoides TaxID=64104 RepID=UPI000BFC3D0B|nr:DNA polymerase [Bacillus pseudomycoides]PHB23082.1 hypothetical protein COE80_19410 [Bacillus pseudomycoides]PHE37611.1 hypothetical protein COF51_16375 [Bacillus pseudomycoides]
MKLPKKPDELKTAEKINETEKKVKKAKEVIPMEQAWENIFKLKNTVSQLAQLKEVKKALEEGIIGRETYDKDFKRAEALRLYAQLKDLKRQDRLDELVENTPENYILVDTKDKLHFMWDVLRYEDVIGYDTETTGVDVYIDKIVGYCLYASKQDLSFYVPIRHETGEEQLPIEHVNYWVSKVLQKCEVKILHNAPFDMHMTLNEGIPITGTWHDTQVRMHQLNVEEESLALKVLATKYLGIPSDKYDELFGKGGFEGTELKYARYYGCNDPKITYQLYMYQEKLYEHSEVTKKIKQNYETIEQPLIKAVVDMERVGFHIDIENSKIQEKSLTEEIDALEIKLREEFGHEVNFNSPLQLKEIFYKKLNYHRHLGGGNWEDYSTNKKTLKTLSVYEPIIKEFLAWRKKYKLRKDFIQKIPELKKPTGKWHSHFYPRGTKTGRFSSKDFNAQQIEPNARQMFIAPKGMLILGADFSGQENRLLGHICQDQVMIDGWKKGIDFYSLVASMTFNQPYEECLDGSKWRKQAKVVVLAVTYGISDIELGFSIGATNKEDARKMGAQVIKDFLARFPAIEPWMKQMRVFAHSKGYIYTMFGNVRPLRKPKSMKFNEIDTPWAALPDWKRRGVLGSIDRKAVNTFIQGSAAEQTKLVMLQFDRWCAMKRKQGREFYMFAPVHDELLFYVPEDITQEERDWIEKIMTQTVTLQNVEVKTDIAIGKNWKDMISWDDFKENGKKIA